MKEKGAIAIIPIKGMITAEESFGNSSIRPFSPSILTIFVSHNCKYHF